jgi:hypothetical protein
MKSYGRTITGTTFTGVTVSKAGTYGIAIDSVSGSATFTNTTVAGAASGGLSNNSSTFTVVCGPGDSGF